jgi:3-hydroxyacyl-[acyl-carrier-protein] dehydratase
MAGKDLIIDLATIDFSRIVAGPEEIRRYNPQRYAMEQLSAIVYESVEEGVCVGYKDTSDQDFWVPGHMPGLPLMPGVIMCEAAAQLSSYYVQKHNLLGADMVGLGGLQDVRFRDVVRPGDRLIVVAKQIKLRRGAMINCRFQCFVRQNLVCEGEIKGVALPVAELKAQKP